MPHIVALGNLLCQWVIIDPVLFVYKELSSSYHVTCIIHPSRIQLWQLQQGSLRSILDTHMRPQRLFLGFTAWLAPKIYHQWCYFIFFRSEGYLCLHRKYSFKFGHALDKILSGNTRYLCSLFRQNFVVISLLYYIELEIMTIHVQVFTCIYFYFRQFLLSKLCDTSNYLYP